jgi:hypothetical protein
MKKKSTKSLLALFHNGETSAEDKTTILEILDSRNVDVNAPAEVKAPKAPKELGPPVMESPEYKAAKENVGLYITYTPRNKDLTTGQIKGITVDKRVNQAFYRIIAEVDVDGVATKKQMHTTINNPDVEIFEIVEDVPAQESLD